MLFCVPFQYFDGTNSTFNTVEENNHNLKSFYAYLKRSRIRIGPQLVESHTFMTG